MGSDCVKQAVDIPVIGSGDVVDPQTVRDAIVSGRVDGVVVARGLLGDLWQLHRVVQCVATGEVPDQLPFAERIAMSRRHVAMLVEHYGEHRALKVGRKYVAWTIKGCHGAAKLRGMVADLDTVQQLDDIWEQALAAGLGPQGWFQPVFISGEG